MIEIRSITGEILLSVPVLKDAVSHEELMASDYIQLRWDSDKGDILPVGTYIEYKTDSRKEKYSLLEPYHPSRVDEVTYRYTPQFQSCIMRWQKIIVPVYTYSEDGVSIASRELDWTYTGTPAGVLSMVERAIYEEIGEAWSSSLSEDLPETITIAAQSSSVWSILSELAEQCETEWWADKGARHIYLSKCSHGAAITLEVGKNIGVPSAAHSSGEYYTRFYAFGSSRNVTQMSSTVQGSIVNKRLTLDPSRYPYGYKDIRGYFSGNTFVSDLYPEEVMVKSLYFEDIYPSSKLTISDVRKRMRYHTDDNGEFIRIGGTDEEPIYDQYAVWYFMIPDFEFKEDMIIENLELSVAFKSGQLRGREFPLTYHAKDAKVADKADVDKEFAVKAGEYEITFDEQEYLIIPGVDYIIPHDDDEVTLFNIEMPEEYKMSAYLELESALNKEIERFTKDNNSYEFDSNPVAFRKSKTDIKLGQNVNFINGKSSLRTRVMMVEKHLDYSFKQKIRVGNEIVKGSRQQLKDEVRNVGEEVKRMNKYDASNSVLIKDHSRELMLTMGRYLSMKDTIGMLQNAVEGYTGGINPITIETMALLVGNEALQFRFTQSREDLTPLDGCPLKYNAETKQMYADPCALIHLTYQIDDITAQNIRTAEEYWSWDMDEWYSEIFTEEDKDKGFYVYAVVENNEAQKGGIGSYSFKESPVGMRDKLDSEGVLYLLVGILNQEYAGTREFLPLYGFTQILPAQITTDMIRSADGSCYFDLANNEIVGVIKFKAGSEGLENILQDGIIGGQNMLRNSGFTGDYLSEPLADESVMEAAKKLYSDPLDHWEVGQGNKVVALEGIATSGYGVEFTDYGDTLRQELHTPMIVGESYVFSFKGRSTAVDSEVTIVLGGQQVAIEIGEEWKTHIVRVTMENAGYGFGISGGYFQICDLQLERGTIATAYSPSYLDNISDRAYYQSLKYVEHALNEGSTTIGGGLVLTNHIKVGNYANKEMIEETGGMQGTYNVPNDPFLWGGGSLDKAIETIGKYKNNPSYQPTEEELKQMANFVVTHGGKAILNDIILRGYVYALGGKIGRINIEGNGIGVDTQKGKIQITPNGLIAQQNDGSYVHLATNCCEAVAISGKDATGGVCYADEDQYKIAAQINAADGYHAIHSLSGVYAGLRPNIRKVTASGELSNLDHTLIVENNSGITLTLPKDNITGQTYRFIHSTTSGVTLRIGSNEHEIKDVLANSSSNTYSFSARGVCTLTYYDYVWYVELNN